MNIYDDAAIMTSSDALLSNSKAMETLSLLPHAAGQKRKQFSSKTLSSSKYGTH